MYIDSIYVAIWTLGPLFRNSGICLWFRHSRHVLPSPNSQSSLWWFSFKSATEIHLINFFFFGVIIELLSFVACRRYGFSRQSKTEKVRNAWLMGEHIWDMEVCFYFASVWHWQAPKRDGTQGSGPWVAPVSRGVPAAVTPATPSWCSPSAASAGWGTATTPHHGTGSEGWLKIMAPGSNMWDLITLKRGPEHPHLMRDALDGCEQPAGSERERGVPYRLAMY